MFKRLSIILLTAISLCMADGDSNATVIRIILLRSTSDYTLENMSLALLIIFGIALLKMVFIGRLQEL